MKKYWGEKEDEICKTISTSQDQKEINKMYKLLFPKLEIMFNCIFNRYFFMNCEYGNMDARNDIFSFCLERIFLALKNKYDSEYSSFSYLQTVIKNGIIESFRKKEGKVNKTLADVSEIDIEDTSESYDPKYDSYTYENLVVIMKQDIEKVKHLKNKQHYISVLDSIIEVLETKLDLDQHKMLITTYVSTKLQLNIRSLYQVLYTPFNTLNYYRLIRKTGRGERIIEIEFTDINNLNNKLHKNEN